MPYGQDYTQNQQRYDLAKSMLGRSMQPVQGANPITALGNILSAYFASKGMKGAEIGMGEAKQGEADTRTKEIADILGAYRSDQPYEQTEAETFAGEQPIQGLSMQGTGQDREAMMQAMMGAQTPALQDLGMESMLAQALADTKQKKANLFGKYQPGDYTAESYSEFTKSGDPSSLVKDTTGRLIKVDRGDEWQFLHPVTGSLVKTEKKELSPTQELGYKGDVKTIEAEATQAVKDVTAKKANEVTYTAYKAGMDDYSKALGNTVTGFLAGRLPAATASQQIADGAKSVMLPLLKQLFRSAGEGVFTDKDQELLEGMLPTRKDHPEAAKTKIDMVNKVVALKLGLPAPTKKEGLKQGAEEGGYRFKGGDPSKQENWEKVGG